MTYELHRWTTSYWTKGTRFYRLELRQDLLGTWVVVRSWGSRVTRFAKTETTPYASYSQALEALERAEKRRSRRGYRGEPMP